MSRSVDQLPCQPSDPDQLSQSQAQSNPTLDGPSLICVAMQSESQREYQADHLRESILGCGLLTKSTIVQPVGQATEGFCERAAGTGQNLGARRSWSKRAAASELK